VLAWLVLFFPAASRGASDVEVQKSGSLPDGGVVGGAARAASDVEVQKSGALPDGGVVGDAAKVTSIVHVQVTGSILPSEVVHEAMGPAPAADANPAKWAAAACRRIVYAYQAVGYHYARAWFSLEEEDLVWIYVDPGHMRVSFFGVGGVGAALFRLSLNLPGNVFHKPTVEHALEELKK
jgi:hypothetical protein